MPHFIRVSLSATLLFTAACTQQSAQIDLKGQNSYARNTYDSSYSNSPSNYSNLKPSAGVAYTSPPLPPTIQTNAPAASIGVNDLGPPQPAAAPQPQASVNPWTNKSHFSDAAPAQDESFNLRPQSKQPGPEPMVSQVHTPSEQPVAQLDRVIGSDGSVPPAKIASSGFIWPVSNHKIISGFGPKGSGKANDGINIASAEGEPVWASADGEVVYSGNELAGYGNMVLIKHADNKTTAYAHLNRITVDKYEHVKQGDIIGYVGATGGVKSPQLHFAIRDGKDPVDPRKYLKRSVAGL